ncbi:MAG: hypothetical protein HQ581_23305, partial [Planctomycetes bacterium]|nr:hypothetical protein [Planctomycetota bacterium]
MRKKAPRLIAALAAVLLIALAASAGAEVTMQTKHWEANDQAFSDLAARIREMTDVNLLTHPGVKIVENGGPGVGYAQGIADGEAGRLAGDGRVQVPGAPSVFTFYLGKPRTIREVGMFTANGDARSNQDYEVRLIDNSANPGQKPAFPEKPTFTSGDKVIGGNRGGFHSSFVDDRGGPIVPGKVDWVQFRIWGTYNVAAGEPAKKGGRDWSAVIELEVLVDESDMPMVTREEIQRRRAERARAIARERLQREQKEMAAIFGGAEPLRRAIVHLSDTYGNKYPKGPEYLKRLNQLEAMLEQQVVEGQKLDAGRLKPLADQLAKL